MKKVVTLIMALALVVAFAVSMSAAVPEADFEASKVAVAPSIDGIFDGEAVWGAPIWSFTGQEALDYDTAGGLFNPWPDGFETTDSAASAIATTFTGYARWDDTALYIAIVVNGVNPYYANPGPQWQGNGIQVAFLTDDDAAVEFGLALGDGGNTDFVTYIGTGGGTYAAGEATPSVNIVDDANGTQVYEMAWAWDGINVAPAADKAIAFCASLNVNVADDLATEDFNGYQVGTGVYNGKETLWDSTKIVLKAAAEEAPAEEAPAEEAPAEEAPAETPKTPAAASDVSVVMYVLATISTLGGAIVLKRK